MLTMDTTYIEPPETPAPIFALRAFKNAIFGTPKTVENPPRPISKSATDQQQNEVRDSPNYDATKSQDNARTHRAQDLSPTKRPGILMTPGTAGQRRKTVSFGEEILKSLPKGHVSTTNSGLPVSYPGKYPSPWTPKVSKSGPARKPSSLTQSLLHARSNAVVSEPADIGDLLDWEDADESDSPPRSDKEPMADDTLDFESPQSASGKHWKSKYVEHREETRRNIQRLQQYKSTAKSFAKKNHSIATELAGKLERERGKMAAMEQDIMVLARRIASAQVNKEDSNQAGDKMMNDLVRKIVNTLEYKKTITQFENVLQAKSTSTSKALRNPNTLHCSRCAGGGQKSKDEDAAALHTELETVRRQLEISENESKRLEKALVSQNSEIERTRSALRRAEERRANQNDRSERHTQRLTEQNSKLERKLAQATERQLKLEETVRACKEQVSSLESREFGHNDASSHAVYPAHFREDTQSKRHKSNIAVATSEYENRIGSMLIEAALGKSVHLKPGVHEKADMTSLTSTPAKKKNTESPLSKQEGRGKTLPLGRGITSMSNNDAQRSPKETSGRSMGQIRDAEMQSLDSTVDAEPGFVQLSANKAQHRNRAPSIDSTLSSLPSLEGDTQSELLAGIPRISHQHSITAPASSATRTEPRVIALREIDRANLQDPRPNPDISRSPSNRKIGNSTRGVAALPPERAQAAKARLQNRRKAKEADPRLSEFNGLGKENLG